jgi:hypothetical protein
MSKQQPPRHPPDSRGTFVEVDSTRGLAAAHAALATASREIIVMAALMKC